MTVFRCKKRFSKVNWCNKAKDKVVQRVILSKRRIIVNNNIVGMISFNRNYGQIQRIAKNVALLLLLI